MSLRSKVVARPSLDEGRRQRMLALMEASYEGIDAARFFKDLDGKHFVIVLEDEHGTLMGFSTLLLLQDTIDGRPVDVVFSGDTVIDPAHWGSKALQTAFGRFCLEQKLKHPRRELYWLLLSKGFRTYLLAVNYFPRTFPKPGATPSAARVAFRDRLATSLWGSAYDPSREILRYDEARDRVRAQLSPPPPEALDNDDVRFFLQKNPGFADGDELVCLVQLPLRDLLLALVRATTKAIQAQFRPKRLRRVPA
jgi:hypothetical protein